MIIFCLPDSADLRCESMEVTAGATSRGTEEGPEEVDVRAFLLGRAGEEAAADSSEDDEATDEVSSSELLELGGMVACVLCCLACLMAKMPEMNGGR